MYAQLSFSMKKCVKTLTRHSDVFQINCEVVGQSVKFMDNSWERGKREREKPQSSQHMSRNQDATRSP